MTEVHNFLTETTARVIPRILTQICRDPGAPFYGSCDRNWWHYKIRDFSSIILQQAGYALSIAAELPIGRPLANELLQISRASARFWNHRATLHGAFEEYYPYEQGYPPVAFSTLAMAKLCHQGIVPIADIQEGLAIAARQLLTRFEAQAANQQIAGTAALSVVRTIAPSLVDEKLFQAQLTRILDLQHSEGWFPEYDGPDLGYLAVSIDCLYDIHDHTADSRILTAIRKAANYIAWFALSPIGGAGMHNSRNTDYITPYGLVRLALEEQDPRISATVDAIFSPVGAITGRPNPQSSIAYHPFDAVDDRYWCHYIGHSVFRALVLLEKHSSQTCDHQKPASTMTGEQPGSGHALLASSAGCTALVSARKGCITTAKWPDGAIANDFGWIVQSSGKTLVSHWWSNDWKISLREASASCEGFLVPHKEHVSTPWKHIVLRVASYLTGRRLIKILKRLVIFKKPIQTHRFTREVSWDGDTLVIRDRIEGLASSDQVTRAPRTSKRHVASADSFHPEDLQMLHECKKSESIRKTESTFDCETRYQQSTQTVQP
ncbi:MAG: hypothetical protein ACO3RV_02135 [Luteolibacter sp.]